MQEINKVVVIGPESTGKSTLCRLLARHFQAVWCPEYAREYLLKHGTNYTYEDLLTIAKGQLALEEQYTNKAIELWKTQGKKTTKPMLFVDTDMHVVKVWSEFVFGKCNSFILDKAAETHCDLYLLCNVDLPWVKDELREYPDLQTREKLYDIYKDILIHQTVTWVNIKGDYDQRLQTAVEAVGKLII